MNISQSNDLFKKVEFCMVNVKPMFEKCKFSVGIYNFYFNMKYPPKVAYDFTSYLKLFL